MAVEAAAGRTDQAREAADRLSDLAGMLAAPAVRLLAHLAAGTVCRADGSPELLEEGIAHLEAAVEGFGLTGLPLEQAAARMELAQLLASTSPEVAVAEAQTALDCFERLSARHDADRAAGVLRGLGAGGRNRPRTGGPLTKRESEVLALLAEGMSNSQAAARLSSSAGAPPSTT